MQVTLIGMGCGGWNGVLPEGAAALYSADAVLGPPRLLDVLPETVKAERVPAFLTDDVFSRLTEQTRRPEAEGWTRPCVLYGGDTGFHAGARSLIPLLRDAGILFRVIPGVSSVQVLAARLGRSWEDWALCSAHGSPCDAVTAVSRGRPAFFLTAPDRPV